MLEKVPKGMWVVWLLVPTLAIYLIMVLGTLAHLRAISGGLEPFDLRPMGYDFEQAHALLSALGADGRWYYLWRQIPLDMVYPGFYVTSFVALWLWISSKVGFSSPARLWAGVIMAAGAGVFDYAENIAVITMISRYPDFGTGLVMAASIATIAKSAFTTVLFTALMVLGGIAGWRAIKKKAR